MSRIENGSIRGLAGLCIFLGFAGLAFVGASIWLFIRDLPLAGLVTASIAALCGGAGYGLFLRKKWGIVLLGLLGLVGSVNHLARIFNRYRDLSQAGVLEAAEALFSITLAILIPAGLIYVIMVLWRRL